MRPSSPHAAPAIGSTRLTPDLTPRPTSEVGAVAAERRFVVGRWSVAQLPVLTVVDAVLGRVVRATLGVLVFRFLGTAEIATYGIGLGIVALCGVAMFAPETVLYRHFWTLRAAGDLPRQVRGFLTFALLRTAVLVAAVAAVLLPAALDRTTTASLTTLLVATALVAAASLETGANGARELLRFTDQAGRVLALNLAHSTLYGVALVAAAAVFQTAAPVAVAMLAVNGLFFLLWVRAVRPVVGGGALIRLSPVAIREAIRTTVEAGRRFSFWAHVQGAATSVLYAGDIGLLAYAAFAAEDVAAYTVVTRLAALLLVVPLALQSTTTIRLGRDWHQRSMVPLRALGSEFAAHAAVSLLPAAAMIAAFPLIATALALSATTAARAWTFAPVVLGSVTLVNFTRPLISQLQVSSTPMRTLTLAVYLPAAAAVLGGAGLLIALDGPFAFGWTRLVGAVMFAATITVVAVRTSGATEAAR